MPEQQRISVNCANLRKNSKTMISTHVSLVIQRLSYKATPASTFVIHEARTLRLGKSVCPDVPESPLLICSFKDPVDRLYLIKPFVKSWRFKRRLEQIECGSWKEIPTLFLKIILSLIPTRLLQFTHLAWSKRREERSIDVIMHGEFQRNREVNTAWGIVRSVCYIETPSTHRIGMLS